MSFLKLAAAAAIGGVLFSAAAFTDSQAGPGTARSAVNYGVGNVAGMIGEAANVVPRVVEEVRPALQNTMNQAGDVLGQQGTATQPRDDVVDPADQGSQP